mgnify:FL=1
MLITLSGIVMLCNNPQSKKAYYPMLVTPSGIVTVTFSSSDILHFARTPF